MTDGIHDEYPVDDRPEERERRRQAEADGRFLAFVRRSLTEHQDAVLAAARTFRPDERPFDDAFEAGLVEARKTSALVERVAELEWLISWIENMDPPLVDDARAAFAKSKV